eukprot:scaffold23175_cov29-Tisochrysis_lutea.AAC.4
MPQEACAGGGVVPSPQHEGRVERAGITRALRELSSARQPKQSSDQTKNKDHQDSQDTRWQVAEGTTRPVRHNACQRFTNAQSQSPATHEGGILIAFLVMTDRVIHFAHRTPSIRLEVLLHRTVKRGHAIESVDVQPSEGPDEQRLG